MSSTEARPIQVRHRSRGIPTPPMAPVEDWVHASLSAIVDHPELIEDMPRRIRQIRNIYGKAYAEEWIARSMHKWITTGAPMDRIARELKVSLGTAYNYRKLMSAWMRGNMKDFDATGILMRELHDYAVMEERMWTDARDGNATRLERRLALAEVRAIKAQKTALLERVHLFDNQNLDRMASEAMLGGEATKRPGERVKNLLRIMAEAGEAAVIEGECREVEE